MVSRYAELLIQMEQLKAHPIASVPIERVQRQASKGRMTVWQRLEVLTGNDFDLHWRNFGKELDGAGIVTAIGNVNGRQVGIYGHDFTQRAGAMDEQNGDKLAAFLEYIGKLGLPLIGMNDSAGALIQAGVASLQGYAKAFRALRQLSGRVPSIMLMFGYNAGGGAYLPRQGSFVIQPAQTFVGLTGPAVVQTVLGEAIEADALGGPGVHLQSGVADYTAIDERAALEQAKALLHFLPNNSSQAPPPISCSDDP